MSLTTGRRVEDFDDLERAGDYCLARINDHGTVKRCVWFLLPIHQGKDKFDRPTEGSGIHMVSEPPWTITENPDGSVSVQASILSGRTETRPEGYWHGYLDPGHVWRQV